MAPARISNLESHLGYWLRYVSNHVSHAFAQKVAAHDVTVAEWVVLRELYPAADANPSEVADKLGMTRGAISKIAERLVAKDLVARTPSTTDRRYHSLTLTSRGKALVPRLAADADRNDKAFFGHLDNAERQALERLLRGIVRRSGLRAVPID